MIERRTFSGHGIRDSATATAATPTADVIVVASTFVRKVYIICSRTSAAAAAAAAYGALVVDS